MRNKTATCSCGATFKVGRDSQHKRSNWHKVARGCRYYRKAGLSYAEIARQVGLSRNYVLLRLQEEGL
jgi:hypothetical protein